MNWSASTFQSKKLLDIGKESPSLYAIGHIDEPQKFEEVGRYLRLKGWIITPYLEKAELFLDQKPLGELHPFIDRGDVEIDHPEINVSSPIGFDQIFELPEIAHGPHILFLKSVGGLSIQAISYRLIKWLPPLQSLFSKSISYWPRFKWMIKEPTCTISTREINYDPTFDHIIKTIGVETSRICNFHCDMCPAHSEEGRFPEQRPVANDRLIERVIPFLKNYHHKIARIDSGSVWGEPLMNAGFFSNTERILEAYPEAFVDLTTNGSLLTPKTIERLFNIKNLRQITVSVDAGTKQTYERIRRGGKWDVLIHNLSSLIENKKIRNQTYPIISTNFVAMKDNFQELPKYVKKMSDIGVEVISVVNAHNCYSSDSEQGIFDLPTRKSDIAKERKKIVEELQSTELPEKTSLHLPSFSPNKKSAECSLCAASTIIVGIEGNVYPCCVLQSLNYEGKPEAKPMGNIFEKNICVYMEQ